MPMTILQTKLKNKASYNKSSVNSELLPRSRCFLLYRIQEEAFEAEWTCSSC